jgi:hypothetical protein
MSALTKCPSAEFTHSAVYQKTLDEKEAAFAAVAEHKD